MSREGNVFKLWTTPKANEVRNLQLLTAIDGAESDIGLQEMRFAYVWNAPENIVELIGLINITRKILRLVPGNGRIISVDNIEFHSRQTNQLSHVRYEWTTQPLGRGEELDNLVEVLKFLSGHDLIYEIWENPTYLLACIVRRKISGPTQMESVVKTITQTCPAGGQHKLVGKSFTLSSNGIHTLQECGKCHTYVNPNP